MRSKKLLSFVIQGTLENEHVLCFILLCEAKITFLFLVHFVKKKNKWVFIAFAVCLGNDMT